MILLTYNGNLSYTVWSIIENHLRPYVVRSKGGK